MKRENLERVEESAAPKPPEVIEWVNSGRCPECHFTFKKCTCVGIVPVLVGLIVGAQEKLDTLEGELTVIEDGSGLSNIQRQHEAEMDSIRKSLTPEQQLSDAALLLRLAVRKLKRGDGSAQSFAEKIVNWLKRNDLQGSILRERRTDAKS